MNGRIYDPKLGRFLQADPIVQAPKNSQNLNRYSYVLNNPLSYTDPSGYFIKELGFFVAAIVRVIYTWEDPSAWVYLAVSAKNLFNAMGSQQSGMPTGATAGSFTNGFTTATSFNNSGVQHDSGYSSGDPKSRARAATIGSTDSDQTGWKFANGGDTGTFAFVIAIGVGETTVSLPAGGFIDFLYAGARILPVLSGGAITVLTGGILYPSGLLDDPLTHPSYCPNGCSGSIYPGRGLEGISGLTVVDSQSNDGNHANPSKSESEVWKSLKPFRGQTKTNGERGRKREFYEWDHSHNDIEVYDHRGNHKGSADPSTGEIRKAPVPGRRIDI